MTNLPTCRWRDQTDGEALSCRSEKYVSPPNRVDAEFCLSCGYRDHEPAANPDYAWITAGPEKIALATLYTPEIANYGWLTSQVLTAYARRHGYRPVIGTAIMDAARPPAWSKLVLIQQVLAKNPSCEWLMWIDADALITNPDIKVEAFAEDSLDFVVADDSPMSPINTGVFLMRNCPAVLDLIRRAYAKVDYIHHPWWEQLAVAEALRESDGRLRSRIVSRRLFNSFVGEHQEGDFILHFAGWRHDAKATGLRQAAGPALAAARGKRHPS